MGLFLKNDNSPVSGSLQGVKKGVRYCYSMGQNKQESLKKQMKDFFFEIFVMHK